MSDTENAENNASTQSTASTEGIQPTLPYPVFANSPSGSERDNLGPHVRVGAIVWGVICSALATATLVVVGVPERRVSVAKWFNGLNDESLMLLGLLIVGIVILLLALVGGSRRAQRRARLRG